MNKNIQLKHTKFYKLYTAQEKNNNTEKRAHVIYDGKKQLTSL